MPCKDRGSLLRYCMQLDKCCQMVSQQGNQPVASARLGRNSAWQNRDLHSCAQRRQSLVFYIPLEHALLHQWTRHVTGAKIPPSHAHGAVALQMGSSPALQSVHRGGWQLT